MKRLYSWGSNKYVVWLMHLFFWLLFMLPLLMESGNPRFAGPFKYRIVFNNLALIILFYWNAYFLYNTVYKRRGVVVYIFTVLLSALMLMCCVSYAIDKWLPAPRFGMRSRPDLSAMRRHRESQEGGTPMKRLIPGPGSPLVQYPFFLAIIAVSFSYSLIREHNLKEKQRKERETETLKTELGLLRSQISPHFMFNVLNSLVALARKKSDLMEPSLIQLSALMRYVLYENSQSRIALAEEVAYLKNYIELQSLRFGDDIRLDVEMAEDLDGYEIEPMLLIPFIENAFKHGIGSMDDPYIRIRLNMNRDNSLLTFSVENRIAPAADVKDEDSGIGLKNVKRRLELLYPEKHIFEMNAGEELFEAVLTLKLT
ncbi:MAG TPA: histidine kinase [Pedobacter sp.]|uniref:sensor histidine kinase n=1 Tax=Pedobacter sp. TaxID=1411316 RepID=UPI002C9B3D25|nr:histidine kinase [Pedobacter sp.]HMI02845.1 histidine kinase [Pedobacter sp.]